MVSMKKDYAKLPYRDNVVCVVFQGEQFLLVQKPGWPEDYWKFPQGGINERESEFDAAQRELSEEIGSNKFKIHCLSGYTNQYDWDERSIELAGNRWRGQKQKFVLVEFLGVEGDLKIDGEELRAYKWVRFEELQSHLDHDFPLFTGYRKTIAKVIKECEKFFN